VLSALVPMLDGVRFYAPQAFVVRAAIMESAHSST